MQTTSKVVGMVAGGRQHIVAYANLHDPVLLVPEPTNRYDPNAVAVYTAPRSSLLHPDDLVSSITDPDGGGHVHDEDRRLLLDRQAGYIPKELAARLDLPAAGIVGFISQVRYKPADERLDRHGNSHVIGDPTPAGFDVTGWFTFLDGDPEGGEWGA